MYTFIRGINIHICQPFVNLREMVADYVQLTKRPFLGCHTLEQSCGSCLLVFQWDIAIIIGYQEKFAVVRSSPLLDMGTMNTDSHIGKQRWGTFKGEPVETCQL